MLKLQPRQGTLACERLSALPEVRGSESLEAKRQSEALPEVRGSESLEAKRRSEALPEVRGSESLGAKRRSEALPEVRGSESLGVRRRLEVMRHPKLPGRLRQLGVTHQVPPWGQVASELQCLPV